MSITEKILTYAFLSACGLLINFIPTFFGYNKIKGKRIFLINWLLGWTILGWIYALILSIKDKKGDKSIVKENVRYILNIIAWIFAFWFTLFFAGYQRMTGPTYPMNGKITISNEVFKYALIRTYDGADDAKVKITVSDTSIKGEYKFIRMSSNDNWTTLPMTRQGEDLIAFIPHQPIAGKVKYQVYLIKNGKSNLLNKEPAEIRFKGPIPMWILLCHILTIFMAMLFSTRAGLEVIFKGKYTYLYSWVTLITLFIGGLFLGPIVQKYSFNAYWTGWPFGHDMTDNKSLVAFIFWIVAIIFQTRDRERKAWTIIASIILLIVFLIPHSVLGSEHDYTKDQKTEVEK
ncbi:MAG: superinfection immunity protein [Bacteroidetes bacterium]|nr:superinfection immunity protein [Bacteroidota bacterium]